MIYPIEEHLVKQLVKVMFANHTLRNAWEALSKDEKDFLLHTMNFTIKTNIRLFIKSLERDRQEREGVVRVNKRDEDEG